MNEIPTAPDTVPKQNIETNRRQTTQTPRSSQTQGQLHHFEQTRLSPPSDEDALPEIFKPKLVPKPTMESRADARDGSEEIELPPTPVQLGVNKPPERPRGLASSSSPRGSKLGSGRRRRRRTDGPITSSPLKPRTDNRAIGEAAVPDMDRILVDEAQESEADDTQDMEARPASARVRQEIQVENNSAEVDEKEAILRNLRAELEKLRSEVAKLDAAVDKDEFDDSIISLLFQGPANGSNLENFSRSSTIATDEEKATQYLNLFSPGDLRLSSSTETKKLNDRTKIVHSLTLTAPPPWPAHAAIFTFEVTVDAEDARVERVSRKRTAAHPRGSGRPTGIHRWVSQRLDHPLHWRDVGGIVWGLGQWFSASVERARIFHQLDQQSHTGADTYTSPGKTSSTMTERDAIVLTPYLNQIQIQVQPPRSDHNKKTSKKKILLVWDINIDWTGEVKSAISVSASGVSAKASRGLQDIFSGLFPTKGVVKALEHVNGLLHGGEGDESGTDSPTREPTRRRKRKRVVLV